MCLQRSKRTVRSVSIESRYVDRYKDHYHKSKKYLFEGRKESFVGNPFEKRDRELEVETFYGSENEFPKTVSSSEEKEEKL